jgi:hypothetical protein
MLVGYWSSSWYSCTHYALTVGWSRVSDSSTRGAVHFAPVYSTPITKLATFNFIFTKLDPARQCLNRAHSLLVWPTTSQRRVTAVQGLPLQPVCFINGNINLLFSSARITSYLTFAIKIVYFIHRNRLKSCRVYCSVTAHFCFRGGLMCSRSGKMTSSVQFYFVWEEE